MIRDGILDYGNVLWPAVYFNQLGLEYRTELVGKVLLSYGHEGIK